jgi:hypothetical protein
MPFILKDIFTQPEHIKFLTEKGYDLEESITKPHPITHSTVLHDATIYNRKDIIEVLAHAKIDLNQYDEHPDRVRYGRTPLLLATHEYNKEMVSFLIQKRVNPHKCEKDSGMSPLMLATLRQSAEIMNLLIEAGVNISQENKKDILKGKTSSKYSCPTALMYAASRQDVDLMCLLIRRGSKLKNSKGTKFLDCCHDRLTKQETLYFIRAMASEEIAAISNPIKKPPSDPIINIICGYAKISKKYGLFSLDSKKQSETNYRYAAESVYEPPLPWSAYRDAFASFRFTRQNTAIEKEENTKTASSTKRRQRFVM